MDKLKGDGKRKGEGSREEEGRGEGAGGGGARQREKEVDPAPTIIPRIPEITGISRSSESEAEADRFSDMISEKVMFKQALTLPWPEL